MPKRDRALYDRLRSRGVRKSVAAGIADASGRVRGSTPKAVKRSLENLRSAVGEIEDRVSGGPAKRKAAAKKAAQTRKQKAAKRSAAAKKGARTRART
jgi:hypothetical protein